ncbi:MAG: hypothetical protein COV36_00145 [Alphaproteobacteria bacterium CG11_big_fil_rev_8_21_14_0_20_44_7]|nr:MAG: hypothetical protein COV36_00145 [Alphaproteobacteria bacterium CG11_big_fil_rev_8_21_14_0_20_44_7]
MERIQITDSAAARIAVLLEEEKKSAMRITVDAGGCNGFQYKFDLDEIAGDDIITEKNGIKVVTDPTSIEFLGDAQLDFIEELGGKFFKISNPNASSSCGCGSSFAV